MSKKKLKHLMRRSGGCVEKIEKAVEEQKAKDDMVLKRTTHAAYQAWSLNGMKNLTQMFGIPREHAELWLERTTRDAEADLYKRAIQMNRNTERVKRKVKELGDK